MKFTCDRCNKRYATAEDPVPGKVYKIKCRACGHLIVVKSQAGTSTAIPALTEAELTAAAAGEAGSEVPGGTEIDLEIEADGGGLEPLPTPEPTAGLAAVDGAEAAAPAPQPIDEADIEPLEPTPAIALGPLPVEVARAIDAAAPTAADQPALEPPPPERDELADFTAAAAEVMAGDPAGPGEPARGPGYVDLFGDGGAEPADRAGEDRFAAAARASLPDGYVGTGAHDPLAPLAPQPAVAPPAPVAPPAASARPPRAAERARKGPAARSTGAPVALIGVGMVVMVAITAVALTRGRKDAPAVAPAAPAPAPAAPVAPPAAAPLPAPEIAPVAAPAPAPAAASRQVQPAAVERSAEAAEPPPHAAKPARAEKRSERRVASAGRVDRRAEAAPSPAPAPPPEQAAQEFPEPTGGVPVGARAPLVVENRDLNLPDAATALTPDLIARVVASNREAFTSCIKKASAADVQLDGRQVALRITITGSGRVAYPTLDDVPLNSTDMGQCLKSAAKLMVFPKFRGDPFHAEVPLTLSR